MVLLPLCPRSTLHTQIEGKERVNVESHDIKVEPPPGWKVCRRGARTPSEHFRGTLEQDTDIPNDLGFLNSSDI